MLCVAHAQEVVAYSSGRVSKFTPFAKCAQKHSATPSEEYVCDNLVRMVTGAQVMGTNYGLANTTHIVAGGCSRNVIRVLPP